MNNKRRNTRRKSRLVKNQVKRARNIPEEHTQSRVNTFEEETMISKHKKRRSKSTYQENIQDLKVERGNMEEEGQERNDGIRAQLWFKYQHEVT